MSGSNTQLQSLEVEMKRGIVYQQIKKNQGGNSKEGGIGH